MAVLVLAMAAGSMVFGATPAQASVCSPKKPNPEVAHTGVDQLVSAGNKSNTDYGQYGMAGTQWYPAPDLGCSDVFNMAGNSAANTVFAMAKDIDQVTLTVYQASSTGNVPQKIMNGFDRVLGKFKNTLYMPYLDVVIILAAVWFAWHVLIRKRATKLAEGTVWMLIAITLALWIMNKPQSFTTLSTSVTNAASGVFNNTFSRLPGAGGERCFGGGKDTGVSYSHQGVDNSANSLWTMLVCKPWLVGEFGTSNVNDPHVKKDGPQLLRAQAIRPNDVPKSYFKAHQGDKEKVIVQYHQAKYMNVYNCMKGNQPGGWGSECKNQSPNLALFQGKQWGQRLSIGIGALIAAVVAGILLLIVAAALFVLKIGFLLLLLFAPLFLLIGAHPGGGRIIAMRWIEMVAGTLMKQVVIALLLSALTYGYAVIMSAGGLSWGLQVLLISLLTIAAFFYRKPFQHLFSSLNTSTFSGRVMAGATSSNVLRTGATVLPPVAAARVGRWSARKIQPLTDAAAATGHPTAMAVGMGTRLAAGRANAADSSGVTSAMIREGKAARAQGSDGAGGDGGDNTNRGQRTVPLGRAGEDRAGRKPPPLNLPSRRPGNASPMGAGSAAAAAGAAGRSAASAPRLTTPRSAGYSGGWSDGSSGGSWLSSPRGSGSWSGARGGGGWAGGSRGGGDWAPPPRSSGPPAPTGPGPGRRTSGSWSGGSGGGYRGGERHGRRSDDAGLPGRDSGRRDAPPWSSEGSSKESSLPFWLRPIRRKK